MSKRRAIILAAGKGTRMKSNKPKVLHEIAGISMLEHIIRAVKDSGIEDIVTIIGHGSDRVKEVIGEATKFAIQKDQLGTGHAVMQAESEFGGLDGDTLVINGDAPLITSQTIEALFNHHQNTKAKATILTAVISDATGYGRIVRGDDQSVKAIVEEKDASPEEKAIQEFNTGTFVFDNQALFETLANVNNDNAQGEYYITDVIELIVQNKQVVEALVMADAVEASGVNDRVALAQVGQEMQKRIQKKHMQNGVTIVNPTNTYIEIDVEIGQDTVLEPGVTLKGETVIGQNCQIGPNTEIFSSKIKDNVKIVHSVIEESTVNENTVVGPYAHIRPASSIGKNARVGNFVEIKNSTLGDHTYASHLSYVGDATVGDNVNLGSGVTFVNYDGINKHRSEVGDDAFIGCNVNLIAPVKVGDRAFVAAGSTITKEVPAEALAISRPEQKNIEGYWNILQRKEKE